MMAHWAELDNNNVVVRVSVGDNNEPDEGYQWLIDNLGGKWVQTSYTTRNGKRIHPQTNEIIEGQGFRGNFAGIGFTYHEDIDAFIPPKPIQYPSWIIDTKNYTWMPPIPKPDSGLWLWNEETISWVEYDEK